MLTDFIGDLTVNPDIMEPDLVSKVVRSGRIPRMSSLGICTAGVLFSSFALAACNPFDDSFDCLATIVPSLVITVLDSATRTALMVEPTLDVRNRVGEKIVVEPNPFNFDPKVKEYAAYGGAGTFNVLVSAPGYRDFAKTGIPVVITGQCKFPQTVDVNVDLVKSS